MMRFREDHYGYPALNQRQSQFYANPLDDTSINHPKTFGQLFDEQAAIMDQEERDADQAMQNVIEEEQRKEIEDANSGNGQERHGDRSDGSGTEGLAEGESFFDPPF